MDEKQYDFIISKTMYNLLALFGFLIVFTSGLYWGYTFKANEQYFNTSIQEIEIVNYINTKYTYNFIPDTKIKYSDQLANRIMTITIALIIIGVLLLEIGYRNSAKYKYDKPLKQRLKEWFKRLKENGTT